MVTSLPSLRRKILRSFWFLILIYGLLGFFLVVSVQIASGTSPKMIHVNYDSIAAADQMEDAVSAIQDPKNHPDFNLATASAQFEKALNFEEGNTTEPGEKELANGIRASWDKIKGHLDQSHANEFIKINQHLKGLKAVNENGMFQLARGNERLSQRVLFGAIGFFLFSLIASLFIADGLARRISMPLKNIAEALLNRPMIGKRLKLPEANALEVLILNNELNRMWERVSESEKVNVREIIQQKSKMESVLEAVEDALLVVDVNGIVMHSNECILTLISLNRDQVDGNKWIDLPTLDENYIKLRALLNQEMSDSTEIELQLQNKKKQYSARFRQIASPSEGVVAILFLLHDITEKRQKERFRAEFIDLLSHEIKTPLQSLGTATELLIAQKQEFPELLRSLVETIAEDVDRIKAVANEFVQVTQSHSKIMRLKVDKTPLNQVIQEWIKPFHIVAKDRKITLSYKQEGSEVIWANVDRVKFPWVISNLLSNAIRFAPVGSEVIVLLTDQKGGVEIQVIDDGPGVSEEDQKRIFEPFFQNPMTTSTGSKGLFGIGLTIAKEVVEAHDGRIEYYSRRPHGSEFRIVLPFSDA